MAHAASLSHSPVLYAYTLMGNGLGVPVNVEDGISDKQLTWVHLDLLHADTRNWLTTHMPALDTLLIDALLAEETRPRMLPMEEGCLLILRGVNLQENAVPEDMVSLRVWITEHHIISIRKRPSKAVQDMRHKLEAGKGCKTAGGWLSMLIAHLFERMELPLSQLDETLDDIEANVNETPHANLRQGITQVRKQAIIFRRYMAPQRDVVAQLRLQDYTWLMPTHKRQLQESQDKIMRYLEELDTTRERAQITKDELNTALSDKLNRNLYILSVLSAIFLPLGFLTGLLGVNVGGIPLADSPLGFITFCVILLVIFIGQLALFWRLKWF